MPPSLLAELPLEVLIDNVLPLVALKDVLALASTCKGFAALCADDTFWKRKLARDYNFSDAASARTKGYKFLYKGVHNAQVYVWGYVSAVVAAASPPLMCFQLTGRGQARPRAAAQRGRNHERQPPVPYAPQAAGRAYRRAGCGRLVSRPRVPSVNELFTPTPRPPQVVPRTRLGRLHARLGHVHPAAVKCCCADLTLDPRATGQLDGASLGLHMDSFARATKRAALPTRLVLPEKMCKIACVPRPHPHDFA